MRAIPLLKTAARLIAAVAILLGLLLAGGRSAVADGAEPPSNVRADATTAPGVVLVSWLYGGNVADLNQPAFLVVNLTTGEAEAVDATSVTVYGLQASHTYTFRVCANYDSGPVCADDVSVTTRESQPAPASPRTPASPSRPAPPPTPFFTDSSSGDTWVDVTWNINPPGVHTYSYDWYVIRYWIADAPVGPQNPQQEAREGPGDWGGHRFEGLVPNTAYAFQVQGCNTGPVCYDKSGVLVVGTKPLPHAGNRTAPAIISSDSGDTWATVYWNADRPPYSKYHIKVQPVSDQGLLLTAFLIDTETGANGAPTSHTVNNLTPSTTYALSVQGCDTYIATSPNIPSATPTDDCTDYGPPYKVTTRTPTPASGFLVPATISLSPPTVTVGNSVTVNGASFPLNGGSVNVTWDGRPTPDGPHLGGTIGTATISAQGTFAVTGTIFAGTLPGTYTVHAEATGAQATASMQVVAPSSKGTLTLTYTPSGVVTDMEVGADGYVLSGANFTPGQVTVFVDSPQGALVLTATAGADGTFNQTIHVSSDQLGGKLGQHKLVAVQNGIVQAELSVTFDPPLRIG